MKPKKTSSLNKIKSPQSLQRPGRRSTKAKPITLPPWMTITPPPLQQPSDFEFSGLNDYCVDEICEWLPLSSLASLGITCTRMLHICSNYFRRKHPANYIVFSSSTDGEITMSPDQPYVHCFSEQFRTILIYGADLNLFRFVATKFKEKPVKKISFFAAANLTVEHANCMAEILNRVEKIEFIQCTAVCSLSVFLKYCSNMKSLALKSFTEYSIANNNSAIATSANANNQWLLESYPKLQHFHWDPLKLIPPQLHTFFTQNSNLNSIYATELFLPFAQRHSIKLNVLILKLIDRDFDKRIEIFEQLHKMCTEAAIKSLYFIDFHQFSSHLFRSLGNVVGVSTNCTDVHDIVEMFPNLKLIRAQIRSLRHAKEMAQQLIHLEEAFIDVFHIDYIIPFIRFTPKLKTIYINNTDSIKVLPNLNLTKLVKQRKKLANSANVMIYLKEEAYLKIKRESIRSCSPLVQIKSIDSYVTSNAFVNTILDQ